MQYIQLGDDVSVSWFAYRPGNMNSVSHGGICFAILRAKSVRQTINVVFLSCPLVKKHADLSGSFLYSQSTMKDMYSKPTNRTELSIPMKTKSIA